MLYFCVTAAKESNYRGQVCVCVCASQCACAHAAVHMHACASKLSPTPAAALGKLLGGYERPRAKSKHNATVMLMLCYWYGVMGI